MLDEKGLKKQIIYCGFHNRMLAAIIDLICITFLLLPILTFLSTTFIFKGIVPGQLLQNAVINQTQPQQISSFSELKEFYLKDPAVYDFFVNHNGLLLIIADQLFQLIAIFSLITFIWIRFGNTPGKFIMRMQIRDADNFTKPTAIQFLKRIFGYLLSAVPLFLGFFAIGRNPRKQGWHDRFSNTVVIKK